MLCRVYIMPCLVCFSFGVVPSPNFLVSLTHMCEIRNILESVTRILVKIINKHINGLLHMSLNLLEFTKH